ncbi:EamA-like transporter family protein [Nitzschia inconspicua]|uniref:EamA-like transporter family protein n=1 Tax=Nitzschia inconspicua TaxID=303405 RepID=A0A9K3L6P3_9STRA|nr:EamA-like transporter family protein [Nitzschia inconspicua]
MSLQPHWLSEESWGLVLVLISAIFYALAGAFVKLAHIQGGLPSTELVFARGIFQGGLVVLGLYLCRDAKGQRLIKHPFGQGAARKLVWWRGIIGGAGFLLDYHCMSVLPLGDAITLMSLYPIVTIILARIFLAEEIKTMHVAVTVASVVGAVFIAQPTFIFGGGSEDVPTLGYITGLLGSLCLASILILIRKAGKVGVHTFQLLLSWAMFGVLFSVVCGPYEGTWTLPSNSRIWWYTFGVCSVGAGAHFMLNYAGRLAPAGLVSVVRASDIVWAYCFEILIFVQQPNKFTWIGVVLVLGSLVAIGIEKVKQSQAGTTKSVIKHRSSDLPSGGEDTPHNDHRTFSGTARSDEETPEVMMLMNGHTQGKAE